MVGPSGNCLIFELQEDGESMMKRLNFHSFRSVLVGAAILFGACEARETTVVNPPPSGPGKTETKTETTVTTPGSTVEQSKTTTTKP